MMIIMCQYMSQDTSVDIWQFKIILDVDIFLFHIVFKQDKDCSGHYSTSSVTTDQPYALTTIITAHTPPIYLCVQ